MPHSEIVWAYFIIKSYIYTLLHSYHVQTEYNSGSFLSLNFFSLKLYEAGDFDFLFEKKSEKV